MRRPLTDVAGATRRDFLSSMAAVAVPAGRGAVIDFDRSYLHCAPRGAGIWVRTAIECRADLLDLESGASEPYLLSVKAQTGLGRDAAYQLVREGRLRSVAVGRKRLVPLGELEAFVARESSGSAE